jgi:hypothetical protein
MPHSPDPYEPQTLKPYHRAEAITVAEAAELAKRTRRTIRGWCNLLDLGRRIGGQWAVSKIALQMYLDGNSEALAAYLRGDRCSASVVDYFERCNVPLLRRDAA